MDRIRLALARAHLFCAVLPLVFLSFALVQTAENGFVPSRESYPPAEVDPEYLASEMARGLGNSLPQTVITILGLAEAPDSPDCANSPGVRLASLLKKTGARVRASDPSALECARGVLPKGVQLFADPYEASTGADFVMLMTAPAEYLDLDLHKLARVMRNRTFFDATLLADGQATVDAGLLYQPGGRPRWPAWLDPEFQAFVAELEQSIPAEPAPNQPWQNGILMFPRNFQTSNPRGRWYLFLNYFLYPRRFYLVRSEAANGTLEQYQAWVRECIEEGGIDPEQLGPQAIEKAAGWLIIYNQWLDFRRGDFKLEPLR